MIAESFTEGGPSIGVGFYTTELVRSAGSSRP